MWSILPNENINRYFSQYMALSPYANELILHEGQGCVFLPRYFAYNYPSQLLNFKTDPTWIPQTAEVSLKEGFELRKHQTGICQITNNIVESAEVVGGIIKARPGAGKTVMAVYTTATTKRKTLIVIDNNNLRLQWTKAILDYTDCTEDRIGQIGGGKFEVDDDFPFTIALVQTLMSKAKTGMMEFYQIIKECGFDLVFFDECHQTTCGPKYATASLFLNTTNIFGLSATPFADQVHEVLMDNSLGSIIASEDTYELVPQINYLYYDSGLDGKYGKQINWMRDMLRKRAVYNSKLSESVKYNTMMVNTVKQMLEDGHCIIIIVFTVELVNHIHEILKLAGVESRQFYSQKKEIDKEKDNVVVATYKYAGAGFDMPRLSGAILGTPLSGKKSLIQVIGRILREYDGKPEPVVYDFIETGFNGAFCSDIPRKKALLHKEFGCKFTDTNM